MLPTEENWLKIITAEDMWNAIKRLCVRGAPLIGCSAALMIAQMVHTGEIASDADLRAQCKYLASARPTAVNLAYCLGQVESAGLSGAVECAYRLLSNEVAMNERIASHGLSVLPEKRETLNILTVCNTGSLATPGVGTAFGVISAAHKVRPVHCFACETRPLLQGGRLTAFELKTLRIPYTLLCDGAAASLMAQGRVDVVLAGSDRITRDGSAANKIGTYSLAVLARHHGIPFYIVAPESTIDLDTRYGKDIEIEQRGPEEVRGFRDYIWSPSDADAYNPAFDVTPPDLITAFILDSGIVSPSEIDQRK